MNWNRVLNVFLVIFLVLNIGLFVGTRYFEKVNFFISSERQELLEDVLNQNNVSIMAFLPDYKPRARLLLASQTEQKAEIAAQVLGGESFTVTEEEKTTIYEDSGHKLTFYKNENNEGVVSYEGMSDRYKPAKFTDKEVVKIAKIFARDITLSDNNFELALAPRQNDGKYKLQLYEVFKNELLFCSYVTLEITKDGVEAAISRRFKPMTFEGDMQDIFPIDEALYEYVDELVLASGDTMHIVDIKLGYDLDEDEELSGKQIEAIPYYRITLNNGLVVNINAYTLK